MWSCLEKPRRDCKSDVREKAPSSHPIINLIAQELILRLVGASSGGRWEAAGEGGVLRYCEDSTYEPSVTTVLTPRSAPWVTLYQPLSLSLG